MPAKKRSHTPKQPSPVKRVKLRAGDGKADCQGKINIQRGLRVTVPKSPKYKEDPSVEVAFEVWTETTDKVEEIHQRIINAESALKQMYTSLGSLLHQYKIDRDVFLVAAERVCVNELDAKEFGLLTTASVKHIDAETPGELRVRFGRTAGDLSVRWRRVPGAGAYVAQQSSVDPPTEASWVECYAGTRPSFKLTGHTLGEKLFLRIKSLGKTPSAWSEPTAVIVR